MHPPRWQSGSTTIGYDENMKAFPRYRRHVVWWCALAILVIGLAAQQHALSHALAEVHAAAKHQAPAGSELACDQCLQFCGTDGLLSVCAVGLTVAGAAGCFAGERMPPARAEVFTAYTSRAPPAV